MYRYTTLNSVYLLDPLNMLYRSEPRAQGRFRTARSLNLTDEVWHPMTGAVLIDKETPEGPIRQLVIGYPSENCPHKATDPSLCGMRHYIITSPVTNMVQDA